MTNEIKEPDNSVSFYIENGIINFKYNMTNVIEFSNIINLLCDNKTLLVTISSILDDLKNKILDNPEVSDTENLILISIIERLINKNRVIIRPSEYKV